jgi:hypothetical protein
MPDLLALATPAIALVNAAIFLDSLRYKFTNHPKTQEIFGRLDAWAGSHGAAGLFSRRGLFSQYVIGFAELAASALMLAGAFYPPISAMAPLGAGLGLSLMTGAIAFHLFTPLGIDPNRDGGGLFRAACLVWILSLVLIFLEAGSVIQLAQSLGTP